MLFNVIGYDNQVIGQVEAGNITEAWEGAGKMYENVLDVRQQETNLEVYIKAGKCPDCGGHLWFKYRGKDGWYYQCDRCGAWFIRRLKGREMTPSDLYSKISGSFTKLEQLIEGSWVDGSMNQVIEFIKGVKGIDEGKGSQTPAFPFNLPHGEPLCGWEWVNDHMYDLIDYVPRIEVVGPGINLVSEIRSKEGLKEVSKVLRGLKVRKDGNKKRRKRVIVLDPVSNKFLEKE